MNKKKVLVFTSSILFSLALIVYIVNAQSFQISHPQWRLYIDSEVIAYCNITEPINIFYKAYKDPDQVNTYTYKSELIYGDCMTTFRGVIHPGGQPLEGPIESSMLTQINAKLVNITSGPSVNETIPYYGNFTRE